MSSQKPDLKLHDGGHAELGRRMLRAHLEHRYEESRAMVDLIARRGRLKAINNADASPGTPEPPIER